MLLPRYAREAPRCGFLLRKTACSLSTPLSSTGDRDDLVRIVRLVRLVRIFSARPDKPPGNTKEREGPIGKGLPSRRMRRGLLALIALLAHIYLANHPQILNEDGCLFRSSKQQGVYWAAKCDCQRMFGRRSHSIRKARTGSTEAARRAGMMPAMAAVSTSTPIAMVMTGTFTLVIS
jgi:hypothetical protein